MGEARRRKQRGERPRRESVRQRILTVAVSKVIEEELLLELAEMQKAVPKLTLAQYVAQLLELAVERERVARLAAEAQVNLVQPATHVPAGMPEAAARLRAMREGK